MLKPVCLFAGMVAASVVVVGMTMGQSAPLPVTPSRPMAQSAEPRKDVHSPVPPQAGGLENLSEEDRRVLAKRSKDLVEARKAKFEQELAKLQEVIRRLPDAPPELRGRETLDSLTQLQAILLSYKDSAQGVIDQWPDLEVRASNYEKALLSAPEILKASTQDLLDKASQAKSASERERWETAAQIFEGASRHISTEAGRVSKISGVMNRMVEELEGQVEFCDTVSQRLSEIPSNLTGEELDDFTKQIETLTGQFEKIMDSMRQLSEELDNASRPSAEDRRPGPA